MLSLTDFSWRDSVQTPSDEDRKGKFVCLRNQFIYVLVSWDNL